MEDVLEQQDIPADKWDKYKTKPKDNWDKYRVEKKNPIQSVSTDGSNSSQYPSISQNKNKYLQPGENILGVGTDDPHHQALNIAKAQRDVNGMRQVGLSTKAPKLPEQSISDKVSNAMYLPALNEGFNDLVVKPLAGATDLIDRTLDKTYRAITGEQTPDWLRKSGAFDKVAKYYDQQYLNRDQPKNIASDVAEGVVGNLPLMAAMFTGEGEASLATKIPQLIGKGSKILGTTNALNAYKEATDKGEGFIQSLGEGSKGGVEGIKQGLTMDAYMMLGGALGKGAANKLAELGLLKGGKATEGVLHALATGTVFGGTSAGQDLLNGKDIDTREAMKQFGMGLAFELPTVAHGLNTELSGKAINEDDAKTSATMGAVSNMNGESALRTLINTPTEQLSQIKDLPGTHEDLYAKSIEQGAKAYETEDESEKRNAYANQMLLKTQGDVKLIQSKLSDPETRQELKRTISESDEIHPEEKVDLLNKINSLTTAENGKEESTKITPDQEENGRPGQQVAERPENGEKPEEAQQEKPKNGNEGENVVDGAENAPLQKAEEVSDKSKSAGIKKAISEATRIEKKLPPIKLTKLMPDYEALQHGKELVESGKADPAEIAQRIVNEGGNYHHEKEAPAMLYYAHQLDRANSELTDRINDAKHLNDPEAVTLLTSEKQQLDDKVDLMTQANRINSNSWGKLGNIMQIETNQQFNPVNIRSIISENYGGKIPKEVEERLTKAEGERDKAISDLKKATEGQVKRDGERMIGKMRNSIRIVKQSKAELESEASNLVKELRQALKSDFSRVNSGIPIPTETLAVLGKLAVNYFKQGIKDFEGLANRIYDDLKDTGIDRRQVREYLSTYEPLHEESKSRRIELLGRKERSINKQIETGNIRDYSHKPEIPFKRDEEVIKAEQRVADAEFKLKQEKSKSYRATEGKYQRALNWIIRWERRSVLASPLILEKLASAATIGSAFNRMPKQLIGGAYSAIFKGLAKKAPIEGGLNMEAEIKFWKEFSNPQKFVNNAWEILKSGSSPLTKQFSTKTHEHFFGYDALMDMHAIIKDPPKRATYEASLKYAYDWAEKNGLDYTDPLIKNNLENAAFKRAEYEIFQEDSGIAKRVNDFLNSERKRNNTQATYKALLRFLVPISTVPLNIVRRVGSNIFGLPRGLYEVRKAYQNGIDNLKPEQADFILRQLKNGSTGLAYYTLGLFASKAILGGLWNKDDKKGNKPHFNQAAFNEMNIGQFSLDKRIQHALPLQLTQLGATTARIYNYYMDTPSGDPKFQKTLESAAKAMYATAGTQIEEIPMINEPKQAIESFSDPYERSKFMDDLKRRVPGFSIAEILIGKKEKAAPLDKKLSVAKDEDGESYKLSPYQLNERKKAYDKAIKENVSDWTDSFNDNWEKTPEYKKLAKNIPYWKSIGRSDKYISDKIGDEKKEALQKFIEKGAVILSEESIPENPKKNTMSLRRNSP